MKYDYDPAVAQWAWPHLQNGIQANRLVDVLTDDCGYTKAIARRVIRAIEAPMHNGHDLGFHDEPVKPCWAPGDANRSEAAGVSAALVFASLDPHLELVAGVLTTAECEVLRQRAHPDFALLADQLRTRLARLFNWDLAAIGHVQLWTDHEATALAPASRAVIWLCLAVDDTSALEVLNLGMLIRPKMGYGLLVSAAPAEAVVIPHNLRIMASVSFDAPVR